jgi:hypothetical protein
MLIGFGTAGTAFGTMVIASRGVAKHDQGVIEGVINTSRQIGAALGAACFRPPPMSSAKAAERSASAATGPSWSPAP